MLIKKDDNKLFLKHFEKRNSKCIRCGHRISYLDENKHIKFEGHYQTPTGLYCGKCYK